jgi:hypothetical protein
MPQPKPLETRPRLFTVEEANRTLPLVRAIVADIVAQFRVVDGFRQRLGSLSVRGSRRPPTNDPYTEELSQTRGELEQEEAKLNDYLAELERLGVEFKGADGLCDFPSIRDGRIVYLCWRLGEPDIQYWHEADTDFSGRQPIRAAATGRQRPRIDAEP